MRIGNHYDLTAGELETINQSLNVPLNEKLERILEFAFSDYLGNVAKGSGAPEKKINERKAAKEKLRRWLDPRSKKTLEQIKALLGYSISPFESDNAGKNRQFSQMRFWLDFAIDTVSLNGGDVEDKATLRKAITNIRYKNNEQTKYRDMEILISAILNVWKENTGKKHIPLGNYASRFNEENGGDPAGYETQYLASEAKYFVGSCLKVVGLTLIDCEHQIRKVIEAINFTEESFTGF